MFGKCERGLRIKKIEHAPMFKNKDVTNKILPNFIFINRFLDKFYKFCIKIFIFRIEPQIFLLNFSRAEMWIFQPIDLWVKSHFGS